MKTRTKIFAAVATAAAGYYFFASKNATKHRKIVAGWATEMKKDVLKQAKQLQTFDRASLSGIIDGVEKAYEGVRKLDAKDIQRAARELKDNWQKLQEELKYTGALAKKEAGKTAAEAADSVRKTAKKVATRVRRAIAKK
jgi:signal recognition particle subunit SEC65